MKILILDDQEARHNHFRKVLLGHDLVNVYTSKDCIEKLSEENFDAVFLDHDLGGMEMVESGENTGFEVAVWLSENENKSPKEIWIHTMNPVGRKNMLSYLPQAKVYHWF